VQRAKELGFGSRNIQQDGCAVMTDPRIEITVAFRAGEDLSSADNAHLQNVSISLYKIPNEGVYYRIITSGQRLDAIDGPGMNQPFPKQGLVTLQKLPVLLE
jgi:hypothetical protein